MEDRQPIAYFNKALSARTLSKFVYEKEIMALALSIQHWQHYLLGRSFKVYTDHRSSKHLLQQRLTTTDQQCWLAKLMGFQFEVVLILVQRIRLIIPYPVSFLPLSSTPSPLVLIGWISLLSGTKCKMTLAWSSWAPNCNLILILCNTILCATVYFLTKIVWCCLRPPL